MTGSERIFLDTNPVIYYVEKNGQYFPVVSSFFDEHMDADFVISVITRSEYLVSPYRQDDEQGVQDFLDFLKDFEISTSEIDEFVANAAAKIRAKYPAFKLMDSLQLAAAEEAHCTQFLTNDKQLRQYESETMQIVFVEDLQQQ